MDPYMVYVRSTHADRDKLSVARTLEVELGGRAPDGLAALSGEECAALAGVLHVAKASQSHELEAAIEQSLGVVPRMLRGTIRKILFG